MQLTSHQLLGLPVETKAGESLGVVKSMVLNTDTQAITHYEVGSHYVPSTLTKTLLVGAAQVIEITNEKIVVQDGIVADTAALPATE